MILQALALYFALIGIEIADTAPAAVPQPQLFAVPLAQAAPQELPCAPAALFPTAAVADISGMIIPVSAVEDREHLLQQKTREIEGLQAEIRQLKGEPSQPRQILI